MENFGGHGLRKYPLVKSVKNFMISHAKSDFAEIQGHKMFLGTKDSLGLSIKGSYEELESKLVKKEIQKGNVVLDLGANIGYFTLLFAKLVGNEGKVFAFEPEPNNFALLKKNIEINGYKNITLENMAISNNVGKIKLYISNIRTGMHRIYPSHFCTKKFVEVKTTTLDEYFKNQDFIEKISFIKMDVEGSELGILKGMKKIFEKNMKLKLLLEFVPSCIKEYGADPSELLKLLTDEGFQINYTIDEDQRLESVSNLNLLLKKFDGDKFEKTPKGTNLFCVRN